MSLLLAAAVFCGDFTKGLCGFANMLVFGTMLSFSRDTVDITPFDLVNSLLANTVMAIRERKSIRAKIWVPIAVIVILGCIPGALFLKMGEAHLVKVLFGAVVIVIGGKTLVGVFRKAGRKNTIYAIIISVLSGILCGLYGVGALLAAAVTERTEDMHEFRANLCMIFLCDDIFRTVLYSFLGIFTAEVLKTAFLLYPVMLAGLFSGMFLSKKINEKYARILVSLLLIASGISLVVMNLR